MLWHIKLLRISSGLWICRSHSIWWKLDFCQLCNLTAGCNFNNQLLITAFCSTSVGWIKTNRVIYIHIVFCPLTVEGSFKCTFIFCLNLIQLSISADWNPILVDPTNSPWCISSQTVYLGANKVAKTFFFEYAQFCE